MTRNGIELIEATEISVATRRAILEQERQMWANTRYQAEIRLRVQRRIDGGVDVEAALIKDMERCEKAIDVLDEELRTLDG